MEGNDTRRHLDFAPALRETSKKTSAQGGLHDHISMLPAVLAAAFAFAAIPAQAEMKKEWVEYSHGDTKLKGYMAYDDKITGKRPAILMVHDREGMTPKTLEHAEMWAKLGYVSFAADIFLRQGVLPKNVPEIRRRRRTTARTAR